MWRCSYGVINCPICMRPVETAKQRRLRESVTAALVARAEALVKAKALRITANRLTGKLEIAGLTAAERMGADDGSILAALRKNGSAALRAEIARAEQMTGRRTQTIG